MILSYVTPPDVSLGISFLIMYCCELSRLLFSGSINLFLIAGLHTNYSLMEELIACKKAVGKVMPGAPNVSSAV